jgi:hypothetical protein
MTSRIASSSVDLRHRQLDEVGGVVGVGVMDSVREGRAQFGDLGLDQLGGLERVGAGGQRDGDARPGMAVDVDH